MKSFSSPSIDILLANLPPAMGLILFQWSFNEFFFTLSASILISGLLVIFSNYTPRLHLDKTMRRKRTLGFLILLSLILTIIVTTAFVTQATIRLDEIPRLLGFVVIWQLLETAGLYFSHTQNEVPKLIGSRFFVDLLSFILILRLFLEVERTFHVNDPSLTLGVAFLLKAILEFFIRRRQTKQAP